MGSWVMICLCDPMWLRMKPVLVFFLYTEWIKKTSVATKSVTVYNYIIVSLSQGMRLWWALIISRCCESSSRQPLSISSRAFRSLWADHHQEMEDQTPEIAAWWRILGSKWHQSGRLTERGSPSCRCGTIFTVTTAADSFSLLMLTCLKHFFVPYLIGGVRHDGSKAMMMMVMVMIMMTTGMILTNRMNTYGPEN